MAPWGEYPPDGVEQLAECVQGNGSSSQVTQIGAKLTASNLQAAGLRTAGSSFCARSSRARLTYYRDVFLRPQQIPDATTNELVIVEQKHTDCHGNHGARCWAPMVALAAFAGRTPSPGGTPSFHLPGVRAPSMPLDEVQDADVLGSISFHQLDQ